MIKKTFFKLIALAALLIAIVPTPAAAEEADPLAKYFAEDIEGHWAYTEITYFLDSDIVKGYAAADGSTVVRPDQPVTRAEFVTMLVRAAGLKANSDTAKTFLDVKSNDYFYEPVRIASSLGIVNGVSDGTFAPQRQITRDEIAAILVRAFEKTIPFTGEQVEFKDVPDYWAKAYIEKASRAGLVRGYAGDLFKPQNRATRAEAIAMISRGLFSENTNLPDDGELTNLVLRSERDFMQNFDNMTNELIDKYAAGFYKAYIQVTDEQYKTLAASGLTMEISLKGELAARVTEKSNRFALVELTGAVYEAVVKDGEQVVETETNDTSGTALLVKTGDGSWKITAVYREE